MSDQQRPNSFAILTAAGLDAEQRGKVYTEVLVPLVLELEAVEQARDAAEANALACTAAHAARIVELEAPVPMRLVCPGRNLDGTPCARLHIDAPPFDTKPHHTHACQHCGEVWRPAIVATVGVQFLPGFKNS